MNPRIITIDLGRIYQINDYDELARMFLPRGSYELVYEQADVFEGVPAKLAKAREMYALLSEETGRALPWGILTGVKPVKKYAALMNPEKALREDYLVSGEKIELLRRVHGRQLAVLPEPPAGAVSVYIGIPFCPSRCAYCSFPAAVGTERQMGRYLAALYREMGYVSRAMRERGLWAESVYIGGGTPTALTGAMLEDLLARAGMSFPGPPGGAPACEFTVEAGRPDTISYLKALTLAQEGVTRVSVNPQSLHERTLAAIGRQHYASDYAEAMDNVRAAFQNVTVNTDVIAGLPGESVTDFARTLEGVMAQKPENITVHTLSVKRGSKVHEADPAYSYSHAGAAGEMLRHAGAALSEGGYAPYYLYRQKQTVDNLENIGYAFPGTECVYNMRMMQERQTVVALGAGASSKLYFPAEDRIERVFNVADVELYMARIDDMVGRKQRMFEGEEGQGKEKA
ncbi:MAG: coproporphyrinogen dehydrogenase HemZ [Clostridiales Family XIII bacterium]|jgi:oxygen-independent coproporphyrinogen-3 oxidase|nr:coproporphyrinogen dehydrogenase HemZ [Clostridiales Family XIII bacterium]